LQYLIVRKFFSFSEVLLSGDLKKTLSGILPRGKTHLCKQAALVCDCQVSDFHNKKSIGVVKLASTSIGHYTDSVGVNDGCQSVRDDQDRAISEFLSKLLLNKVVCFEVYVGSRLVKNKNFSISYYGSDQADQLLLAHGEQIVAFRAVSFEALSETVDFFV